MSRAARRRRAPALGRIRQSLKRAHIVTSLLVGEMEAWRSRILVLEQVRQQDEAGADDELVALCDAGDP